MNLAEAVQALTGQDMRDATRLHGGDLSDVFRVTLDGGGTCVAKAGAHVDVEARMLKVLHDAGAPVPETWGVNGIVMLIEDLGDGQTPMTADLWGGFGAALRDLHSHTGERFGWEQDYAFGAVAIPGGWREDWPVFWAEQRLMADLAALPVEIARRIEDLAGRLADHLPTHPPPALLHGDLWHGNLHVSGGRVWMIDPAAYYGHAEVDLAMLDLFGGIPPEFTRRYGVPEPGFERRRAIYQLWPTLVHLRLFGVGYRGMVTRLLDRIGA